MTDREKRDVNEKMREKDEVCWACKKKPIQFAPRGCGCEIYCKWCAMKMATGGRCKKCNSFFAEMQRVRWTWRGI